MLKDNKAAENAEILAEQPETAQEVKTSEVINKNKKVSTGTKLTKPAIYTYDEINVASSVDEETFEIVTSRIVDAYIDKISSNYDIYRMINNELGENEFREIILSNFRVALITMNKVRLSRRGIIRGRAQGIFDMLLLPNELDQLVKGLTRVEIDSRKLVSNDIIVREVSKEEESTVINNYKFLSKMSFINLNTPFANINLNDASYNEYLKSELNYLGEDGKLEFVILSRKENIENSEELLESLFVMDGINEDLYKLKIVMSSDIWNYV